MTHKIYITGIALLFSASVVAQKADGTLKSLVNADNAFSESFGKDGSKKAFSNYAANNAITFKPNPVNAQNYYTSSAESKNMNWKPVLARMSKSGDWGLTSGPYETSGTEKTYGQYLSLWEAKNGKWWNVLDIKVPHNKPLKPTTESFVNPDENYTPKIFGEKERAVGVNIITNTESTLNAALLSYGPSAIAGFLNPDAQLLFPGNEPIIGKDQILAHSIGMISKMNLKTTSVNRALGGDLAYSYGVATIDYKADLRESFNYVFVWQRQKDNNWNIILQAFVPAER